MNNSDSPIDEVVQPVEQDATTSTDETREASEISPQDDQPLQGEDVGRGEYWIEISQAHDGRWNWVLWSPNGRAMALSGQSHGRKADSLKALRAVRQALANDSLSVLSTKTKRRNS